MLKKGILGFAAVLAVTASPTNAATIINGSFEKTTPASFDPGAFTTLNAGNTTIDGWSIDSGSIDYIGSYWNAFDGSRSIDLAGNSLGTISQTIATVAGQAYQISFYASKNPDNGAPVRSGTVSFGGLPQTFAYSGANSAGSMNWQLYTFTFVASGASTLLSFAADASAGCCYGPALDNVSIAAVPEPEVWAMLLFGLGAIGWQMRRRKSLRVVTA